jgi:hypothetical protein
MPVIAWPLILICSFLIQAGNVVQAPDCLEVGEKSRLEKEPKLDNRIKIYEEASNRCQQLVTNMVQRQDFQLLPVYLQSWSTLLDKSLSDIEGSPVRKDKSRALRKFEIQLRKAVGTLQDLKVKASVDQFDDFETWLHHAEQVRRRFVDLLFQR